MTATPNSNSNGEKEDKLRTSHRTDNILVLNLIKILLYLTIAFSALENIVFMTLNFKIVLKL